VTLQTGAETATAAARQETVNSVTPLPPKRKVCPAVKVPGMVKAPLTTPAGKTGARILSAAHMSEMRASQVPSLVISERKKLAGKLNEEKSTCVGGVVPASHDPWAAEHVSTKTGSVLHSPDSHDSQALTQNLRLRAPDSRDRSTVWMRKCVARPIKPALPVRAFTASNRWTVVKRSISIAI